MRHQDDPSKQVRFTPNINRPHDSAHQRSGSSGSVATLNSPSETVVFGAQLPTPPSTVPKAPVPGQRLPLSKKQPSASSEEDEWEQSCLSRIARLPDSRGSDSDGKYTGGGKGDVINPIRPVGHGDATPISKSTVRGDPTPSDPREDPSESSSSTFGVPRVQLPGVPPSPPAEGWPGQGTYRGPPSDDGDLPNLPSAPPIAPSDQEIIPHVTVFTKPRPDNERHSSSNNTVVHPPYDQHLHPSAPPMTQQQSMSNHSSQFQGHSRALSQPSSTYSATLPAYLSYSQDHPPAPPPVPKAPSPPAHFQSPTSTTSSTMPGYAPPNSVVSPTMGHTVVSPSVSYHNLLPPPPHVPGQPYHTIGVPTPHNHQHQQYAAEPYLGGWPTAGGHPSTINRSITPQSNGSYHSTGSYIPNGSVHEARTPPETLDPETVAKAQKHAKFAISALNFEDLDTARKELRKALEMLS